MDRLLWGLSFASAALAGAGVAVWAFSYVVEERFSLRRVRGTVDRPEETTLELYWSRGGVCAYRRTRSCDDEDFAPFARQYLGRGWFFYRPAFALRPCFKYAGADRYPPLGFSAGRSRSEPEGAIEWRRVSAILPCWFLVLTFALTSLAAWHQQRIGGAPVTLSATAGFLLAVVPLGLSARRGLRSGREWSRRYRDWQIDKALREGRIETGMTMEQVTRVMAGWTGKRIHYSVGGRDAWEMWEFRRDGDMPAADSPEKPVGVFFRNGAVIVSTQKRPSAETT